MTKSIVIGAGRIALSHLPHIINHQKAELVAIVEPNLLLRFIIRRITGINVVKSINNIDPCLYESAFILTPPHTHFTIAYSLLKDSKHVFIEKPLTLDPLESQHLLDIAKDKNIQFSVGYVNRFHPVYMEVKKLLNNEFNLNINSAEINMHGNVVSKKTPKTWRNAGLGAGCLFDYGCHAIDLSLYLFGPPSDVICLEKESLYENGVIDRFKSKFLYKKNSSFNFNTTISCDWANTNVRKASIEIKIETDRGSIWTDGQLIKVFGKSTKEYSIKNLDTNVSYYLRGEEFQRQLDDFLESIDTNNPKYLYTEDAVLCDKIISKLNEA